jgi:uncharacterized protein (TIGR03067 family)
MMRLCGVLCAAAACLALAADDKKDDAAKEELKKMEGTWVLVSGEEDGKQKPADEVKKLTSTIKGDTLTILVDGKAVFEGTVVVDPTKKPKTIDTTSKDKTVKSPAIYELDGDTFKICVGLKGERPTEFTSKKDSGYALYVYKREKK